MRRLLVLAAGVLGVIAPGAGAATIGVTTQADALAADGQCSLREAVMSADNDVPPFPGAGECAAGSGADAIVLPAGTYKRTRAGSDDNDSNGDLDVTGTTTVTGAGAATTTIDAAQIDRVIDVLPGGDLTLERVTISGGRTANGAGGASAGAFGSPGEPGGGVRSHGVLVLIDCVVTGNRTGDGGAGAGAAGDAGSIGTNGGDGIDGPAGSGGGGGAGGGLWSDGSLTLTRAVVTENSTGNGGNGGLGTGGGGGLATGAAGIGGHGGQGHGGAGGIGGPGGGILTVAGHLAIDASTISGNATGHGGNGGLGQGGLGGITQATSASGAGGDGGDGRGGNGGSGGFGAGIYDYTTTTSITRSLLAGNTTGAGGGGGAGTGNDGGVSFSTGSSAKAGTGGNGFGGHGGYGGDAAGAFTTSGPLTNLTIAVNKTGAGGQGGTAAGGDGGAAATVGEGGDAGSGTGGTAGSGGSGGGLGVAAVTTISHLTLGSNLTGLGNTGGSGTAGGASNGGTAGGHTDGGDAFAGVAGAILGYASTPVTERNTITNLNGGPGCDGNLIDGGHNINNGEGACPGTRVNPALGPLADNGGSTLTERPSVGSPAIDLVPSGGADCAATDQRFVIRPSGAGCDAGAYEVAPPAVAITTAGATTSGSVNPSARATTYHFEYGATSAYGSSTAEGSLPAGVGPVAVSAALDGLAPGTIYHVRLVATNDDGTAASGDVSFTTSAQGGGNGVDVVAPVILSASVKPKKFRRRRGTTFRYKLSEAAKVAFTIQRKKGKRYVKATRFSKASKAGANKRKFQTRKLKPGRYRATLVATDAAGNHSKAKRLTFRIKR
jgi:CSLREA domain-containing protein